MLQAQLYKFRFDVGALHDEVNFDGLILICSIKLYQLLWKKQQYGVLFFICVNHVRRINLYMEKNYSSAGKQKEILGQVNQHKIIVLTSFL
jgi:hypothetical protein